MKSPDQARALVEDVVARARRAGADAADVGFSAHAALDVSVRLGALEDVGRSETEDLGLRVFCGRRNASVSSEEHTSELQSIMRISYAVFCLKNKNKQTNLQAN